MTGNVIDFVAYRTKRLAAKTRTRDLHVEPWRSLDDLVEDFRALYREWENKS